MRPAPRLVGSREGRTRGLVPALREEARPGAVPFMQPDPPRLSEHVLDLARLEATGIFSNYGPVNTQFEQELCDQIFGQGDCLTVCNATIGLILCMREVIGEASTAARRYALMPSFTFAAAAQAAIWCGLTPLFCDVDAETWLPDAAREEELLAQYAGQIAVVVPYATFGNNLDLPRYTRLSETWKVPIVVDAAASLGSLDAEGKAFGSGFCWPVVFSMHATKPFSVGEGGVVYCADPQRIARLRAMGSFGFQEPRTASMPGLNSKLSEVTALLARLQLRRFPDVVQHRAALAEAYRKELGQGYTLQRSIDRHQMKAFESLLVPEDLAAYRNEFAHSLGARGIGVGTYFSPHLAQQPYFQTNAVSGALPVTEELASRLLSLPLHMGIWPQQVSTIAEELGKVEEEGRARRGLQPRTEAGPEVATARRSPTAATVPARKEKKEDEAPDSSVAA